MNEETKPPEGLEPALRIIEEAGWIDDATARASNAIQSEHAQRLTLQHHAADLAQRVADLGGELETERMRLAACGVIAMSDTPESAEKARQMLPIYESASASDVARRVDECMALRAKVAELEAERNNTAAHVSMIARQLGDDALQVDDIALPLLALVAERDELRATIAACTPHLREREDGTIESPADMLAMREREVLGLLGRLSAAQMQADELRARLAEIEAQEPVKWAANTPHSYCGAKLYARPVPAIPEGWKMVPVEPTEAMLEAEADACGPAWSAMIAAAPEHKA